MTPVVWRYAIAFIVSVCSFIFYVYTSYSGIPAYRDSGDLAVAAYTYGIAHPTGYPLYVIIGKLFTFFIPMGNVAYRLNIMSAVFSGLTVGLVFLILQKIEVHILLSTGLALLFAVLPPVVSLSHVVEMYALNTFLVALSIYFLPVCFIPEAEINTLIFTRKILCSIFIIGLAVTNHQTAVLVLPGILLYTWIIQRQFKLYGVKKLIKLCLIAIVLFCLGFTVNTYLPLRATGEPVSAWGNPQSIDGIIRILTRGDYGGMKLHPEQSTLDFSPMALMRHTIKYVEYLVSHFSPVITLIGIIGFVTGFMEPFVIGITTSFLVSGIGFVILSNLPYTDPATYSILEPHLILGHMFFIILIGYGVKFIVALKPGWYTSKIIYPAGTILAVCAIAAQLILSWDNFYRRTDYYAVDYVKNMFASLPPGSVVFNPDDTTAFVTSYTQHCTKIRRDVPVFAYYRTRWGYELLRKRYPSLFPADTVISSSGEAVDIMLKHNYGKHGIYADLPQKFPQEGSTIPQGITYRMKDGIPVYNPVMFLSDIYRYRNRYFVTDNSEFFTRHVISYYSSAYTNTGVYYQQNSEYSTALRLFESALKLDPLLTAAYNNTGIVYYTQKRFSKAIKVFEKAAGIHGRDDNGSILYNLGLCYRDTGNTAEAERCFQLAAQKYPPAGNELGLIYYSRGDTVKAVEVWKQVVNSTKTYPPVFYNLGMGYEKMGNYAQAEKFFLAYAGIVMDPNEKTAVLQRIEMLRLRRK